MEKRPIDVIEKALIKIEKVLFLLSNIHEEVSENHDSYSWEYIQNKLLILSDIAVDYSFNLKKELNDCIDEFYDNKKSAHALGVKSASGKSIKDSSSDISISQRQEICQG